MISVCLKPFRCKWYARVRWSFDGKRYEKLVPLRTKSKVTARTRLSDVKKKADEIVELYFKGESYSLPWMNEEGKTKVEYLTLEDAVEKWFKLSKAQGITESLA